MKKFKNNSIFDACITTALMGLLVYAAYSLWYIFYGTESGFDVHLYTILSGIALGWFFVLLIKELFKKSKVLPKIIAFIIGNALTQGLVWGINASINKDNLLNSEVVIRSFTIIFSLSAIALLAAFISKAKNKHAVLNVILAIIYFAVSCGGAITFNMENIRALNYKQSIKFDTIRAEEMSVSQEDNELCSQWFYDNFSGDNFKFPFTFKVDGKEFNATEWNLDIYTAEENTEPYTNGKTTYLDLINFDNTLKVTIEATEFSDNATCQWVVYIENISKENSGVISDFYAIDTAIKTGEADLYYSMGSNTAASDFSLIKKKLGSSERTFSASEGKPTESYLPYFNISGETCSVILGIGWTGQWTAGISESKGFTNITAKQESFNTYLLPGEKVRSPLVSLSFYKNDNALKGFNLFRNWIMDCVYPENVTQNSYTVMEVAGPTSERTSDEIIEILDGIDESVYKQTDAFWMDAGWYEYNEGWHDGVGNWSVDKSRYDNGICELSEYADKKGLKHTLWYEPERVYPGTSFHTKGSQNDQWLISVDGEDNLMWNLANEDAFKYYCEYLLNSMKENGVTIYRQDFNFAPLKYWQKADAEYYGGRTGICENHYVTNLYKYLDYLTENIDGLIIDNCASGGKRLDLEMAYRSIAFWRSDYNCSYHPDLFDATQAQTYGISFWLPITGTALYMQDEYAARSAVIPLMLMDFFANTHKDFSFHKEQRELMGGNYYPLDFGSFDNNKILAMQFSTEDALSGTALIYKREKVTDKEYTVKLNGLSIKTSYNVYDIDNPEKIYTLTGEELMNNGLTLPLPEGQKAIILMFSAQ